MPEVYVPKDPLPTPDSYTSQIPSPLKYQAYCIVLKFASTLVLLKPAILNLLVSVAVNSNEPLLETVLLDAAPPFQLLLAWNLTRLLSVAVTFKSDEVSHLISSFALLQPVVAAFPFIINSIEAGAPISILVIVLEVY